ncbi:MAG: ABC transporter permease, partial [Actinomycetota bacterium]|nr:ABC transporter permease [Actinomycetota bacterium]
MDDEIRFHLESRIDDLVRSGIPRQQAARRARIEFGNPEAYQDRCRESRRLHFIDDLRADIRFAMRGIRKHAVTSLALVLTLALGIAAITSMFAFVNALLFAPAPGADPGALVWISSIDARTRTYGDLSLEEYISLRDRSTVFSGIAAAQGVRVAIGGETPQQLWEFAVSANYFDVLGVGAAMGRMLTERDAASTDAVAVLSYDAWQRRFAGNPAIVGTTLTIAGRLVTVIGVAPPGFTGLLFGENAQLWIPLSRERGADRRPRSGGEGRGLAVFARVNPGTTREQTMAALASLPTGQSHQRSVHATRLTLTPLVGGLTPAERSQSAPLIALLLTVPAFVLLVACANAGNLRLARVSGRMRELSLRRALGATRGRLVRQLLTESALLAALSGAAGIVGSVWLTRGIIRVNGLPGSLGSAIHLDMLVFGVAMTLALLSTTVFGLVPALVATRNLAPGLKDALTIIQLGTRRLRLRDWFVVSQVAVSLLLLAVAGLSLRSVTTALRVDPGFQTERGFYAQFDTDAVGYGDAARHAFEAQLLDAARALPGVDSAALSSFVPLTA